jgi:hypothetical protein
MQAVKSLFGGLEAHDPPVVFDGATKEPAVSAIACSDIDHKIDIVQTEESSELFRKRGKRWKSNEINAKGMDPGLDYVG